MKSTIHIALMFVLLVLAQAVIFNNLILFNVAMPFVFIYLIIKLPVTMNTNTALTIGFLLGLCMDILSDTPGLNTVCCTALAMLQRPVFYLYEQRDEDLSGMQPSMKNMGTPVFMKYMLTLVVAYCIMVFVVESFSFFNFGRMLMRIICSSAFTFIILCALDSLRVNHEKRL